MDSDGSPNLPSMPYVKRAAFPMHLPFVWTLQAASCSALLRIEKCRKYVGVPGSRIFWHEATIGQADEIINLLNVPQQQAMAKPSSHKFMDDMLCVGLQG